jgi:four helix bundle protein
MNDLQKRIISFAVEIVRLARELKSDYLLSDCLKQVIRSSTSVGANYSEAQSANSLRDFHNKIRIALKEIKETNYWLGFLSEMSPDHQKITSLIQESIELMKILGTISKKTDPSFRQEGKTAKGQEGKD